MDTLPRLSPKEYVILDLLTANGQLYGLELVKRSGGELKRGTVYVTLGRMADKGYVESWQEKDPGESGMPRRLFRATGHGARVFQALEMARNLVVGVPA